MTIDEQTQYILKEKPKIAVFHPMKISQDPNNSALPPDIDAFEVVSALVYQLEALKKENHSLREDFLWCILNSGQLEWIRDVKRNYLKKYFPEEIKKQFYYNGGDLRK